jgi:hypothetical protein
MEAPRPRPPPPSARPSRLGEGGPAFAAGAEGADGAAPLPAGAADRISKLTFAREEGSEYQREDVRTALQETAVE